MCENWVFVCRGTIGAADHILRIAGGERGETVVRPVWRKQQHSPNIFVQKHHSPLKSGHWAKIVTAVGSSANRLRVEGACVFVRVAVSA